MCVRDECVKSREGGYEIRIVPECYVEENDYVMSARMKSR